MLEKEKHSMGPKKKLPTETDTLNQARQLRSDQTYAEMTLWSVLRNRQLSNIKFRRQHPIGKYIADFYCAKAKLIVEVDGDTHAERKAYDQKRTQWLEEQGYSVIRFTNENIHKNLDEVAVEILHAYEEIISKS
jgi:adenine-specific DNA-methyltransferase